MHIQEFNYLKPTAPVPETKTVLVLKEDADYLEGIDLNKISEAERTSLKALVEALDKILGPAIRESYRKYRKDAIR